MSTQATLTIGIDVSKEKLDSHKNLQKSTILFSSSGQIFMKMTRYLSFYDVRACQLSDFL